MGKRSGGLTRLVKNVKGQLSDENRLLEEYVDAAHAGLDVIAVRAGTQEQVQRAYEVLQAHNASNIRHFGVWAVTDLHEQGRAMS
jgi:hypothetical protein